MRRRILFYVQHLLGIGHLVRAGRVAAALAKGFEVLFVVGGEMPLELEPGSIDVVRLPPVRAGEGGFSALVHPDGRPFGADDEARRRDLLLDCFDGFEPDVLLIEAFPFGRRPMRFELLPLLERAVGARRRPMIACSVRDILQARRPEREAETVDLVRRFFDVVLVHGDPAIFPLEGSFPSAADFADRIRYTGMVGPAPAGPEEARFDADDRFDVVVSVGGGAVGADLVEAALEAKRLTSLDARRWLVLTGPNLRRDSPRPADGHVVIRSFDPRLPQRLAEAQVSVSQAGYNTVADLMAAGCRPVLVPFGRGGETEQIRRAAVLDARGWAVTLTEADLAPASLAAAMERALRLPAARPAFTLGGAERSRTVLERELDGA